ncbi:MAG: amidohydrolase family protein, partial [Clostridia bacterium]|nr:amidohydrolase family protein [Clostridia bacterium]
MFNLVINDYDRQVYEKELKPFLPENFIDIHTHAWLNTMTPAGDSNGGATWTSFMADEMSAEQLLDAFKRLFPANNVTPLVFGGVGQVVKECNDYVYDCAKKYNFPILTRTDYSMDPDALAREVHANHSLGLKPYLSFCPEYIPDSEIRIFDFLPHEHLEVANKNGWIVMLHIARKQRLRDAVNIAQLMEIERRYPNVKLICAHIGRAYSKQDLGDAFEILKNTKNMMFDFTANMCDDAIEECIRAVGTERLMFGSD